MAKRTKRARLTFKQVRALEGICYAADAMMWDAFPDADDATLDLAYKHLINLLKDAILDP